MLKQKRAVSEVIASLIILAIVSALGTSLYSFSLTVMSSQQDKLKWEVQTETNRAQERFNILSVGWNGSNNIISLAVLNYGKLDINIIDIYVNDQRVTDYQKGHAKSIHTSKWSQIIFTSPVEISSNNLYEFILISERGVSYVHHWES